MYSKFRHALLITLSCISISGFSQTSCDSSFFYNVLAYPSEASVTLRLRNGNVLIGGLVRDMPALILADENYSPQKAIELTTDYQYREGHVFTLFEDIDGNFVVHAFHEKGSPSSRAISTMKVKGDLSEVFWTRILDDTQQDLFFTTLEDPATGNYVMSGGTGPNSGQGFGCDAILWLVDKNSGEIIKSVDANSGSCERWISMRYLNGAFYGVGRWDVRNTAANTGYRIALTKFGPTLDIEWVKYYLTDAVQDARCYPYDLQVKEDKLYIIGSADIDGDSFTEIEAVLIETDQDGEALQVDVFDLDIFDRELPTQLGFNDQGFQIGGIYEVSTNSFQSYAMQLNNDREFIWATGFEFAGSDPSTFNFWRNIVKRFDFQANETVIVGAVYTNNLPYLSAVAINGDGSFRDNCLSGPELNFTQQTIRNPETYTLAAQTYSKNRNVLQVETTIEVLPLTLTKSCGFPDIEVSNEEACAGEEIILTAQSGFAANISANGTLLCNSCNSVSYAATNSAIILFEYNSAICSVTDTLYLSVFPQDTSIVDILLCNETTYTLPNGEAVSSNGVYFTTSSSPSGCLSVTQSNVVFDSSTDVELEALICQGDSIEILGQTFYNEGDYVINISGNGCDARVDLQITESPVFDLLSPMPTCDSNAVDVDGITYYAGDTVVQSFISIAGCDSFIRSPIIAYESVVERFSQVICNGSSYTFEGSTYNQPGTYTASYLTSNGCDSTLELELSVVSEIRTFEDYFLCEGDTLNINGSSILLDTTLQIESTSFAGCDSIHTISVVSQENPSLALLQSIGSCNGDSTGSIRLSESGVSATTIRWTTGEIGNTRDQLPPGFYSATITDEEGCSSTNTFEIVSAARAAFTVNTTSPSCLGDQNGSIQIGPPDSITSTSLADSSSSLNSYSNLEAGSYTVNITDINGCSLDTVLLVDDGLEPPSIFHESPIIVSLGDSVRLRPSFNEANTIRWLDSTGLVPCDTCIYPWVFPTATVSFSVEVTDTAGCTAISPIVLNVIAGPEIGAPTAFSPNGDGVNDRWQPRLPGNVLKINEIMIFDRWGDLVFKQVGVPQDDPTFGWDGTFRDQPMNPAVFAFVVNYQLISGVEQITKGDLTLIR